MDKEEKPLLIEEFLKDVSPNQSKKIKVHGTADVFGNFRIVFGDIELFCESDKCKGPRYFSTSLSPVLRSGKNENLYIEFNCNNCKKGFKIFSIFLGVDNVGMGIAYKYGELPPYGPQTSSKLISMIGEDKEMFLAGRRAEFQGMGIGAFAYYRRVVENQRNRIIDKIVDVSTKLGNYEKLIEELKIAKTKKTFSESLDEIKIAFPEILQLNGHNPLTLLHKALSEGIHDLPDEECLELATSIRQILTELVEKMNAALKEQKELDSAVTKLLNRKKTKNNQ